MFFVHYPRDLREGVFVVVMRIPHCFLCAKICFFYPVFRAGFCTFFRGFVRVFDGFPRTLGMVCS